MRAGYPYSGTLETASRLVISYVPQDASGLRCRLRDYAAGYGLDESLFLTILRKLGFERVQFEKDMGDYSAGQKKRCCWPEACASPPICTSGTSR